MSPAVAAIESCEWLFLRAIEEPHDNALRVVVEEARAGAPVDPCTVAEASSLAQLEPILQGARFISHSDGCRIFEVAWGSYIAYSVRNESFVTIDKSELSEGRLLVKYTKSHFLNYVELGTFATAEYPGSYSHWGIICGNHIIDVVATEEPQVKVLENGA